MPVRIYMDKTSVKVSKPGYDARTAADNLLLLSLDARSGQFLTRGYLGGGTPVSNSGGVRRYTFTILYGKTFTTVPDIIIHPIISGQNRRNDYTQVPYTKVSINFQPAKAVVSVVCADGTTTGFALDGISYAVMRKRVVG